MDERRIDPEPTAASHASDAELAELSRQLRRLARHVTRDEAAADDLVQDAWLAALETNPTPVAGLTAWLRGVVRNVAGRKARQARARADAELMAAASESDASELEMIERISTYRALRDRIDELREPSRTVLRMRYFDERTPPEIAAELGRPLETVRTQLQRGLVELRVALERRRHPGRSSWLAALFGWMFGNSSSSRVPRAAAWSIGIAVVATLAILAWNRNADTPGDAVEVASRTAPASEPATLAQPAVAERQPVAVVPEDEPAVAAPPRRRLDVLVVDPEGTPATGATVVVVGAKETEVARLETDATGRISLDVTETALVGLPVLAAKPGGVIVTAHGGAWSYAPRVWVECAEGATVVSLKLGEKAQRLAGRIVDESGQPIAAAKVALEQHLAGFRKTDDGRPCREADIQARTDAEGRFTLDHAPRREHRLRVQAAGYRPATNVLRGDGDEIVADLVLARGAEVRGRVTRADGSAVAGARVWRPDERGRLGQETSTFADDDGRFALSGLSPGLQYVFASDVRDPASFAYTDVQLDEKASVSWNPKLVAHADLVVRVVRADESAVVGAVVALRTPGPPAWAALDATAADGTVRFRPRPLVGLECAAITRDNGNVPVTTRLAPGASGEVTLRIGPQSTPHLVRLRVTDRAGQPPRDARVLALALGAPLIAESAIAPETGEVVDLRLVEGNHRLCVVGPQGLFDAGVVAVGGAEVVEVPPITAPAVVAARFEWPAVPEKKQWSICSFVHGSREQMVEVGFLAHGDSVREFWPGSYELSALSSAGVRERIAFEVKLGEATPLLVR